MQVEESMSKKQLPASVLENLSKAGKEGIKHLTLEDRARGGRNSWKNRLKKAQDAEKENVSNK